LGVALGFQGAEFGLVAQKLAFQALIGQVQSAELLFPYRFCSWSVEFLADHGDLVP
jgi:hypothetical protein